MIRKENRFDEYAYRIATFPLDESVDTVEEGQWVTLNADGKVIIAGEDAKKAFLVIGSKRVGRDKVSGRICQDISFLLGHFALTVSNFDSMGSYTEGITPLKIKTGGILTPVTSPGTETTVAYAIGAPKNGYLRIIHE